MNREDAERGIVAPYGWREFFFTAFVLVILPLAIGLCVEGCGTSGPKVLLGSEVPIEVRVGDTVSEDGWLFSPAAFALIQELIAMQDARIQELEAGHR